MTSSFLDLLTARHSHRAFLPKAVSQETITKILEAARYAPSGANMQPWKVVAITQEQCKPIGEAMIAAKSANVLENPDYQYYPTDWFEPYKGRRKACGLALYSSVNIEKNDKQAREAQWQKNYFFFGAPVGLFFFLDRKLAQGSWLDLGMFIQNVMLAARALGCETCPQASMAEYPDIVRKHLTISDDLALACGMALGYSDEKAPINQYRTEREPVSAFTTYVGFDKD